jgi:hypothetical protein
MKHHQELAKPETLFISLDSVGGGELHCLTARFRSLKAEVVLN